MTGIDALGFLAAGLVLGTTVSKKWLIVPAVILPLLLNFLVRGWAPPLPVLRHLGMRTHGEINRERNALLASKGNAAAGVGVAGQQRFEAGLRQLGLEIA